MNIIKPTLEEVPEYYKPYIDACDETNLIEALTNGLNEAKELFSVIPENKQNYSYSEGKWTIKEVLIHINDTERVFGYRVMRFGRKDDTPLANFKENFYVSNSYANTRTLKSISCEFEAMRIANIELFKSLNETALNFTGTANKSKMTTRGVGWMIAGHAKHHYKIIKERYL